MAFAGWSDVLATGPVPSVADWYLGGSHDSAGCAGPEAVFARPFYLVRSGSCICCGWQVACPGDCVYLVRGDIDYMYPCVLMV